MPERIVVGWDVGGAHLKSALLRRGEVLDAAQWPCPLWQGLEHLDHALAAAHARWPRLAEHEHAVTMTGEMVDLFEHRQDGVQRIAELLARALPAPRFFAGAAGAAGAAGWCGAADAGAHWQHIASANWLATARQVALAFEGEHGVMVDIGSTTTDLIAFGHGRVLTDSRCDAQRLERSELVYQGVVRTPLCALARRIAWRGAALNVMNEFFANTADVYRLSGELDPAHDQQPSADSAAKDLPHTRARLARMIGLDACDGSADDWLAFARAWRTQQLAELQVQLERVTAAHRLGPGSRIVGAGCGAFLVHELVPAGWRHASYGRDVVRIAADAPAATADWAQVAAPAVAVALLFEREQR